MEPREWKRDDQSRKEEGRDHERSREKIGKKGIREEGFEGLQESVACALTRCAAKGLKFLTLARQ